MHYIMYALHAQQHLQNFILSSKAKDCQPKSEKPQVFLYMASKRRESEEYTVN